MPKRKLPRTDEERDTALRTAKNRKDAVPPPLIIPYTGATITRLDTFQPAYRTKYLAVASAKNAQTALTEQVLEAKQQATYYILDFIDALNRAIRRKQFLPSVRALYNIDVNDDRAPEIDNEADVTTWGENIDAGETTRIAAGGAPITFPSLAQVNTAVGNFNTLNAQQSNAKEAYDIAQEALAADNPEADKLILKLWNETETAFDEGNKSSMRRKAREWGVVYTIASGEVLSPEEFSITGKISLSVPGAPVPVADAVITVLETGESVLSQSNGNYFITVLPAGTYTLVVDKVGYTSQTINNVAVVEGEITTVNVQLVTAASNGSIVGTVTLGGNPASATVSIDGTTFSTNTAFTGVYTIENIPAGNITVRATIIADPVNFQTQNVTVVAGVATEVNFSFP